MSGFLICGGFAVGCSSSTGTPKDAGSGGAGGAAGTGGTTDAGSHDGSAGSDGGADHTTDGAGGAGGASQTDGGAGTGGGGADAGHDAAPDVAPGDATSDGLRPCTTSFGAGNPVQYAFDLGANSGWYQFVSSDLANSGFTTSLGASYTDGHSCPGALQFGVNFTAYGPANGRGEGGATEIFYGTPPNGKDWSAYKNLHAWVKSETADPLELYGVYFYVKSNNQARYASALASGASLASGQWQELVVDLTNAGTGPSNGVTPTDINLIGFEVVLNSSPPAGAPATPSQAVVLMDDIWLEARPPSDAGSSTGDATTGEGGSQTGGTDAAGQ